MNLIQLALLATAFNIGTIYCIKMCAYSTGNGNGSVVWYLGIAVTILATQFIVLRGELDGKPLGLMIATVVTFVMIAAALFDIDQDTGKISILSPASFPPLRSAGYLLAIVGVALVGRSQYTEKTQGSGPSLNPATEGRSASDQRGS